MRRRRRTRVPLLLVIGGVCAAFLSYVFGLAWLQSRGTTLFGPEQLLVPRLIDVIVFIWLFWVGSAIGSFLNVVAWRMPRGESVNGRSYCPRCHTRLKARDNFPVFGWLALQGRCRCCRLPISPRYPIVEAIVGSSLTLVGVFELYRLSLPGQAGHWHGGPFWAPVVDEQILWTLLYHTVALSFSWAMGLIRMDGHRLPARLVGLAMVSVAIPMLIDPRLMVVPWQTAVPDSWQPAGLHLDALMRILTGLVAAVIIGRYLASGVCPGADPKLDPLGGRTAKLMDMIVIIAIPAVIVGWQAAPAVAVLASIVAALLRLRLPSSSDALGRFAIAMPIALTIQITLWRRLADSGLWPTVGSPPWLFLASVAILFLVPLWLHDPQLVSPPKREDFPPNPDTSA